MKTEPVLTILAGLAGVLGLVLVATNALGWTALDPSQLASSLAAVAGICGLAAVAIRSTVYSPDTYHADVAKALALPATRTTPGPLQPGVAP